MNTISHPLLLSPILIGVLVGLTGCGDDRADRRDDDTWNRDNGVRTGASTSDQRSSSASPAPGDAQAKGAERTQVGDPTHDESAKASPTTGDGDVDRTGDWSTGRETRMDDRPADRGQAADNTGRNVRDRDAQAVTPADQSNRQTDLDITAGIRQVIVGNDGFSNLADNIKIVTRQGMVTLRGPVENAAERTALREVAMGVAGVRSVDNQLEVLR